MEEGEGNFLKKGGSPPRPPLPSPISPPKVFIRVNVGKGGRVVSVRMPSSPGNAENTTTFLAFLNKNNTPLSFSDRTILHQGFDNVESL